MPLTSEKLVERFNARQPPTGILFGMKVLEVDQSEARVKLSFTPDDRLNNPRGMVQGGMVAAMLDDAAAMAGIVAMGEPGFITSLEIKTSFFAPTMAGTVFAEGRCLKMGKSACFLEADLRDGDGTLLARLTSTAFPVRSNVKPKLVDRP
jgi:uncharacterized protein (TIGR00369 family)